MSLFLAPKGAKRIAFDGETFDVKDDGTFAVPDKYDAVMQAHGYQKPAVDLSAILRAQAAKDAKTANGKDAGSKGADAKTDGKD